VRAANSRRIHSSIQGGVELLLHTLESNELFARLWFARDWMRVAASVVGMCGNRLDNGNKYSLAITFIHPTINTSVARSCYLRPP
jgi:hypothetical protein